jgi:hypothetical protein
MLTTGSAGATWPLPVVAISLPALPPIVVPMADILLPC